MMIAWTGVYFKREKRIFQKSLQRKIRPGAQGRGGADKDHFVPYASKVAGTIHMGCGKHGSSFQGLFCRFVYSKTPCQSNVSRFLMKKPVKWSVSRFAWVSHMFSTSLQKFSTLLLSYFRYIFQTPILLVLLLISLSPAPQQFKVLFQTIRQRKGNLLLISR